MLNQFYGLQFDELITSVRYHVLGLIFRFDSHGRMIWIYIMSEYV